VGSVQIRANAVRTGIAVLLTCSCSLAALTGCSSASAEAGDSTTASLSANVLQGDSNGSPAASSSASSSSADSLSFDVLSSSVVPGSKASSSTSDVSYRDGVYYASGKGKLGDVPVTVVIDNGMITRISIGENHESPIMAEKAQETVIPEIVSTQSTDVDVASGATATSNAIIEAVNQALQRAAR
jgi:NosR/NirI family nitrous oxide reductase transcriptional regulator